MSLGLEKLPISSECFSDLGMLWAWPSRGTLCWNWGWICLPTEKRMVVGLFPPENVVFLMFCNWLDSSPCPSGRVGDLYLFMHSFLIIRTPFFKLVLLPTPLTCFFFRSCPSPFRRRPLCFFALLLFNFPGDDPGFFFSWGDPCSGRKGLTTAVIYLPDLFFFDSELLLATPSALVGVARISLPPSILSSSVDPSLTRM